MSLVNGGGDKGSAAGMRPAKPKKRAGRAVMRSIPSPNRNGNGHGISDARDLTPPFRMAKIVAPKFRAKVFDIRDHGAVADDHTDCTLAIADAITAAARSGGGRVLVPAGKWFTGPIHLRSNIELHLADGATVRFSDDCGQYLPPVFVRWSGIECYSFSPLIYARNCDNIAITGSGQLLGQGKSWWNWEKREQQSCAKLYEMALNDVPVEDRLFGKTDVPLRPQFILPINCTNVLLEDFTIAEGGPMWTVHLAYCENVSIRGITVNAPEGPNNDGIVIDSSRNVIIEDCSLNTREDCIALKSGLNEDGRRVGKPTENVIVRRTRATGGAGGITIGSDMSGGVRNVFVHDCHYDGPSAGIRMKACRGRGGVVEEITVQDITMGRITGDAIQLTTEYPSFVSPNGAAPVFRNIRIRNVACEHANTAARMVGLSDSLLRQVTLEDLTITANEGLHCASANDLRLLNVRITPTTGPILSLRDSQRVLIEGINTADGSNVFLDLRGRQTRDIRLRGETQNHARPAIVLGVDVPKDALVHE